jgi:cytochrome c553
MGRSAWRRDEPTQERTVIALTQSQGVILLIGGGIFVLIAGGILVLRGRTKPEVPDIPRAMRPGPSDPDLETPILVKLMLWGTVLVVAMALSVAAVFVTEPETNKDDTSQLLQQSILRGHLTTLPGTEENQLGFNCVRCHGPGLHGGQNLFNGNLVAVPNLQIVCNHLTLDQIVMTIAQGRPGTDMPSWSVQFSGAMDDQQINDVVNYILSIQKVAKADNKCLPGGAAASPSPSASASASAGASPSASASP